MFKLGSRRFRRLTRRVCWLLSSLMLSGIVLCPRLEAQPRTVLSGTPSDSEVRALWVVRTTLTSPEKIRAMVDRAATNGFNTIIVQVRGRGDAYYRSNREPRAVELKDQPEDFDALAFTLKEAKQRGLKVHAWLNTCLLANLDALPTDRNHVYNRHPEWLAVPRAVAAELYNMSPRDAAYRERIVGWSKGNRAELEGIYVSPANSKVRDHIYGIWMDVLKRYPELDGLHFDYVRLASPDFDYSRTSLDQFRKWLEPQLSPAQRGELKISLKENPLAAVDAHPEKFAAFQRQQITLLVKRIYEGVKKLRPDAIVSAAVFANDENAYTRRFQDWRHWLQLGILDVVCPMAYSTDTAVFQKQIDLATSTAHASGRQVWAGIGAYRIPAESTIEKIAAARKTGADGLILFSYDSTSRQSELNPDGAYLEKVRVAFSQPAVPY